jgi:hypothetical protein
MHFSMTCPVPMVNVRAKGFALPQCVFQHPPEVTRGVAKTEVQSLRSFGLRLTVAQTFSGQIKSF